MSNITVALEETIEFLNRLVEIDHEAMKILVLTRVPCNQGLADHPTVQVREDNDAFNVGMLGVLNGLFGINPDGYGNIIADFESDGQGNLIRLLGFTRYIHER